MLESFSYWIHLVAAMIWVGSQVFLLVIIGPSLPLIDSVNSRRQFMTAVTRKFGYLGAGALAVLVLTGIGHIFDKDDAYQPLGVFDYKYRYAWFLTAKLVLAAVVVGLTAWHAFVHGPRMLREQGTVFMGERPSAEAVARTQAMRTRSIMVSVINLGVALVIVFLVTLMQNYEFAFTEV